MPHQIYVNYNNNFVVLSGGFKLFLGAKSYLPSITLGEHKVIHCKSLRAGFGFRRGVFLSSETDLDRCRPGVFMVLLFLFCDKERDSFLAGEIWEEEDL